MTQSRYHALSRRHLLQGGAVAALGAASFGRRSLAQSAPRSSFPTSWTFGDVTITKVIDVIGPYDAAQAYPGAPIEAFEANADWLSPHFYNPATKAIIFSYHSYVVRTPKRILIVDTCIGNDKSRKRLAKFDMRKGPYLENLRAAGVRPEDVDFVTCSHFHSDHVGWNTRLERGRWVPTFPKAKYMFNKAEVDNVQSRVRTGTGDVASYEDSILPILDSGQAEIIRGDAPIDASVTIVPSPGHTPGHQSVTINSRGKRAVLAGDILHSPMEVLYPEWICVFDQDKTHGIEGRKTFIEAHVDKDITVFAAHFDGPTAGKIVSTRRGGRMFKALE
ncbi:MAG: MBL fold metallo-hydrolase [Alphaproteobacteria bacterium]|nr:MBL fold metallo-hydrolase [Alphaproteobacteria bacterium]